MIVCICLDNNNGMLFNNRRQSRDKKIIDDLYFWARKTPVFIQSFSEELFRNRNVIVDNDCLDNTIDGEFCFIENCGLSEYQAEIATIFVYRWNREYPADFYLDIDLSNWELLNSYEFEGDSHEKITREIYVKE